MELVAHKYLPSFDDCSRESFLKSTCAQNVSIVKRTSEEEEKLVYENKKCSGDNLEERWKDYFRDPSQWLDKRDSKTNPKAPDFQHKTSDEPLWIYSWFNPSWVQEELRKRGLQTLFNPAPAQNGAFYAKKRTTKENAKERDHFTDQEEKEEEEVGEVTIPSSGIHPVIQEYTGVCTSYDALLKVCSQQKDLQRGTRLHVEIVQKGLLEHDTFVGSSLVNMYAKCGALSSAQDVFDKLPIRNKVSWNALIGGYAQHGHGEDALLLFEQMQQDGFSPDKVTFICILKACGTVDVADKGKELHAQIARYASVLKDIVVGTALVEMYGRFGMLIKAQEVFDGLPVRNVVSWNVLIARYSDHGRDNDALDCFDQMLQVGISPSVFTFVSTLKACGNLEALDLGQEVHAIVVREGFSETDMVVGTALVDMCMKCGAFTRAEQVFHELSVQNVVSWNILIAGYAQHGHGEKALDWFKQMQFVGISPDAVTFTCVLKACGSIEALGKGQEIHDHIARDGALEKDMAVAGALVDMYVKCGAIEEAKEVCSELPERNVILWTVLIAGYTNYERAEEALDCYEQMLVEGFSPDVVTFPCILKACGLAGALEKGKAVHAQIMKDSSLSTDTVVGTAVVDMYARCGLLEKAQEVFSTLPGRNSITWNALIAGYAQHVLSEEALDCYERMKLEGFSPDAVTFLSILKACGSLGAAYKGQEIHAECVRDGLLDEDITLGTALVDMYARCGMLVDAQDAFDELPVCDVVSWNVLIAGYAQHSQEEALTCLEQMQSRGFAPDIVTFISIFRACCNLGTVDKGLEAHSQVVREGLLEEDMFVNNVLVDMYANFGMLAEAHKVFNNSPIRDVVLWNGLFSGYAQIGEDEMVFSLFDQMKGEGTEPDLFTFTILLNTCSHGGLIYKGQVYYETMCVSYNMIPTLEHVACLVDLVCRAGQVEKAVAVIRRTPFCDTATIWHTVLAACRRWQNTELGSWVFEQAVELDEKNAAAYVCMSNIFATTGKQENKGKLEVKMLSWANPAHCWWMDTHRFVHMFDSEHVGHSQSKAIDRKLEDIAQKIVDESAPSGFLRLPRDVSSVGNRELPCRHSIKSAIACALINTSEGSPIRVCTNMRMCEGCHSFVSLTSKSEGCQIWVWDAMYLHVFNDGLCSCG